MFENWQNLSLHWNNLFCSWEYPYYMRSNRMRNIHMHIRREYGEENVKVFCWWEKMGNKMVDFSNHRRFTLRCLKEDIIPVSIRLKSTIRTPKGHHIIRKAERALLNERIRLVNNTITMLKIQVDTCKHHLKKKHWTVRAWKSTQGLSRRRESQGISRPYSNRSLNLKGCAKRIGRKKVTAQTYNMATMIIQM